MKHTFQAAIRGKKGKSDRIRCTVDISKWSFFGDVS